MAGPRRTAPAATWARAWVPLAVLVLAQIGYPLTAGRARTGFVVAVVVLGCGYSVGHAWLTRGPRVAGALVAVAGLGGLAVEAVGLRTGYPFGGYAYAGALGPRPLGVPLVVPLAWTWMAWPAWLATTRLAAHPTARVLLSGLGLAAWDLFLDPQMVAGGYWRWHHPAPALPGVPGVPLTNYLGWLIVATGMMALLALAGGPRLRGPGVPADAPMRALYVWTYASSVLALAAFLGLPAAAGWGALGMGPVALAASAW